MSDVLIVTPEKWDSISRGWARREYVQKVSLMIIDEIHLLGVDRGPVLVSAAVQHDIPSFRASKYT
jgi:replicative superfamily II helicase